MFKNSSGSGIRVLIHHITPVFIGVLHKGTSRQHLKLQINRNLNNPSLEHQYKEMDDVEIFDLATGQHPEKKHCKMSSFANAVRSKIDINKL